MTKHKAIIDDGCNSELVAGAELDGMLEIPKIKAPSHFIIPSGITPFSMRERAPGFTEAIGFQEMDINFSEVLRAPNDYIEEFKQFSAVLSPDCSLYRDAPLSVQIINLYRNRALGSYFQRKGVYVIPQIRWGSEATYTTSVFSEKIAFLGVEKHSIVAIGTYGCIKGSTDKDCFKAGLAAMLETLVPEIVLVYGSTPESIFGEFKKYTKFIAYPDWTTRMHGGGR